MTRILFLQETMRAQDKELLGQLQRCQETIESIKQQRSLWEEGSEDDLDEGDEDHWEDWEITGKKKNFQIDIMICHVVNVRFEICENEFVT